MKNLKRSIAVLLLVTSLVGLSACGQSSDDLGQSAQESNNLNTSAQDQNGRRMWGNNSPDIYGEVKSVSGRKVTLALIEIPQRRQPTEEEMQQMRERRQNSQDRNNSNNGIGRNRREGQGFGGMTQRKLTGENMDIEIPSSAEITTFERGNNDLSEKKLKVEDIKVGMTVQIWYKKDNGDKKEIETIRVMQTPAARSSGAPDTASSQDPSPRS
ncbi:MAG TPA: hypothetical protein VIO64_04740 [Pseudobacteroides sp.]|uniref:hypothetical protein n=1 Tax=Pseudobacteroides sp. TaxID=1968840 RepID=UPI002F928676